MVYLMWFEYARDKKNTTKQIDSSCFDSHIKRITTIMPKKPSISMPYKRSMHKNLPWMQKTYESLLQRTICPKLKRKTH